MYQAKVCSITYKIISWSQIYCVKPFLWLIFHGEVLEAVVFSQEWPPDQELGLRQVCRLCVNESPKNDDGK